MDDVPPAAEHPLREKPAQDATSSITKEDIGKKVSVDDYNHACRQEVMKYKDLWDDLTRKMGYWVNLDDPYITFTNEYIETLWFLLKKLYDKGLLYKGYTIQPYSPAADTGLSSHELNMPGCYRDVKDTSCTAQFRIIDDGHKVVKALKEKATAPFGDNLYFRWTEVQPLPPSPPATWRTTRSMKLGMGQIGRAHV